MKISLFDVIIAGMMFITFVPKHLAGFFFVFYSIFVVMVSMALKRKREIDGKWLFLICYASLISLFVHQEINVSQDGFMLQCLNTMVMFEGFIYVLFGCLFIKTAIEYSSNLKLCFWTLPIVLIPSSISHASHGRITPIVALGISLIVYLALKRKYLISAIAFFICSFGLAINWNWVVFKFACRPMVFIELLKEIKLHPFVGSGFNQTLSLDNMIAVQGNNNTVWGMLYRHNDILSIGGFLGVVAIIGAIGFVVWAIKRTGVSIYAVTIWTILLTSLFQMTMFDISKAVICLPLICSCIVGATNRRMYEV